MPLVLAPWFVADVAPTIPTEFVGPAAALVLTLVGLAMFATERVVPGSRVIRAEAAAAEALKIAQQAVESQKQMATALEERNRLDQDRLRLVQAGLIDERGERRGIR